MVRIEIERKMSQSCYLLSMPVFAVKQYYCYHLFVISMLLSLATADQLDI